MCTDRHRALAGPDDLFISHSPRSLSSGWQEGEAVDRDKGFTTSSQTKGDRETVKKPDDKEVEKVKQMTEKDHSKNDPKESEKRKTDDKDTKQREKIKTPDNKETEKRKARDDKSLYT